jgi:hypothetical protein
MFRPYNSRKSSSYCQLVRRRVISVVQYDIVPMGIWVYVNRSEEFGYAISQGVNYADISQLLTVTNLLVHPCEGLSAR